MASDVILNPLVFDGYQDRLIQATKWLQNRLDRAERERVEAWQAALVLLMPYISRDVVDYVLVEFLVEMDNWDSGEFVRT